MNSDFLTPSALRKGDRIAILSPASAVDPQLVDGAATALGSAGFSVEVMPGAKGRFGSYSGDFSARLSDMRSALADPSVKAILCSRGGYGCAHLLGHIEPRPVWIIGFSDVSALHALWLSRGIRSIHGSMAKELTLCRAPGNEANLRLLHILTTGEMPAVEWGADSLNRNGSARGVLVGGNLAVLNGLAATPYDIMGLEGSILVVEDIAEPIYKVERVFHRLRLSGALDRIAGLVVGRFTDYRPGSNGESMEQMIRRMVDPYGFPVAFNAPFGHFDGNLPFVEGCRVEFRVEPCGASLISSDSDTSLPQQPLR